MKKFIVTLTNGVREEQKEMKYSKDWCYDKASAMRMADSMTNSAWKPVRVEEIQ